jgi:flavin reductase (DIM6/NTAB) family NADH-FMN oxidoreductase RutF
MEEKRTFRSIDPAENSVQQFHAMLVGAVAPRPIALASTLDAEGRPNLAPFSFFNVFGANPPIMIFSPSRRGRDNTTKHTYENVKEVPEVVINVVNFAMADAVNRASYRFPKGVNEFEQAGFTMEPSEKVKPFRVKESPVQFECRVMQVIETGLNNSAGNLIICEVVMMHVREEVLDEKGRIDPQKIDLVGRLGGEYYVRASGSSLFTLPKPDEQ